MSGLISVARITAVVRSDQVVPRLITRSESMVGMRGRPLCIQRHKNTEEELSTDGELGVRREEERGT